jgi:hypothetical protein
VTKEEAGVASEIYHNLTAAKTTATILDNLKAAPDAVKCALAGKLNLSLKSQLSAAVADADLPVIRGLFDQMQAADLSAANGLSVEAFAKQQLDPMVADDPAMQIAVDRELAKLSDTTTIGALLQLDAPLKDHPLFAADVLKTDVASLLATSPALGANQKLQADFIERYAASNGSIQDFWAQLAKDPQWQAVVPELQFTLQLGALTENNAALVAALRKQYQPKSVRDLAALTAANWTQLITSGNIPVPETAAGSTAADQAANYAKTILSALQSAFPTDYIAQSLSAHPQDKSDPYVAQFLKSAPQFDLVATNLQQHLTQNPQALDNVPQAERAAVISRLGAYQRAARVHSNPQVATSLVSVGLDSAYKIASLPSSQFLNQYAQSLGGADYARAVYKNARHITASALNFFTTTKEGLGGTQPAILGNVASEVGTLVQQIPNWQELFGATSYCTCNDCRSVLSAAAYLADLLHLLSKWHSDPTNPASASLFDVLNQRRPDLAGIQLNCKNTNALLPYVDLVNEILESVVTTAPGQPPVLPAYNTPSDATADELGVNAEYTSDAAYAQLTSAFYPFALPFDRFLASSRSYLEFAGSSLYQVMKKFQQGADPAVPANSSPVAPSDQTISLEYSKIAPSDLSILTEQTFQGTSPLTNADDLAKYYGMPPGAARTELIDAAPNGAVRKANVVTITTRGAHRLSAGGIVMVSGVGNASFDGTFLVKAVPSAKSFTYSQVGQDLTSGGGSVSSAWYVDLALVKTFLKQTGVTFQDLECLLKTHFLNSSQAITLQVDPENPCDIDSVILTGLSPLQEKERALVSYVPLHKFYRFIRLYAKLGWTTSDLDVALTSLAAGDITASVLDTLSKAKQLQDTFSLTPSQVQSLWGNLDTEGTSSLYSTLFQNKSTLSPSDPLLALQYDASVPAGSAAGLSVLAPFAAQISFAGGQLKFGGNNGQPMTANQERFLLSLSTDSAYRQAVTEMFIQKQTTAPLANLPAGFVLPARLPDSIYYQGSQVVCIGKMSDALRTELKGLSTEPDFQLVIDNLYNERRTPATELAIATQTLTNTPGQLIPAQMVASHAAALLAALRIPATDLAVILNHLWSQSAPAAPVLTANNAGGSLASGTYFVKVSTVDAFGEWLYSNEVQATVVGPNGSIGLTWTVVPGATSYNVYYTLTGAGSGNETLKINSLTNSATISTTSVAGSVVAGAPPSAINFPLSLSNLSAISRHATLASALGLSAADLIDLIQLTGINPFQPSKPGTLEFVEKAKAVTQSNFSVTDLNYVYRNVSSPASPLAPLQSDLDQFVSSLQSSLSAQSTDATLAVDPTGSLLTHYLQSVLSASDAASMMSLIGGSIQFSAPLATLPLISFPASLGGVIGYAANALTLTGPMSAVQQRQLLALSADPAYQAAIQSLYQQSQAAWTTVYKSSASATALPSVSFPSAFSGTASNAVTFLVGTAPAISSVTPPAGQSGASVTIAGTNFGAAQGTSTVTLNGAALPVTSWSNTQIVVTLPANAATGSLLVIVGGIPSGAVAFPVGAMPVVSSVTPPVGQSGVSITIAGTNFGAAQGTSTVTLNGTALPVTSWSNTQIVATLPANAATGFLVVTVGGIPSSAVAFSIGTTPVISSVTPPAGQSGASVTIAGTNFGATQGTSTATLNGTTLPVTSWSNTQIVVTLPANAATGSISIAVAPLICFDASATSILFAGPMSADQESSFIALSSDPNYLAAIRDVYNQSAAAWAATYTAPLATLPVIALPTATNSNIAFNQAAGTLVGTGALSAADAATLLGLSTSAAWLAAIESLYSQPRQLIFSKLLFLDAGSVIEELMESPSSTFAEKCGFLLNALLKSIDLVVQAISATLHMDSATVKLLIVGGQDSSVRALLNSSADPNIAAIADFFALLGNGLSAACYPNRNFQGALVQPLPVAPAIDFSWGATSVPSPGLDPNAFSAKWSGQLLGQFTETYTLYAQVSPPPPAGTVTLSGVNVTWVSGANFDPAWSGAIYIKGKAYTIQSVVNPKNLVLTSSAGIQNTPVPFCVSPIALMVNGQQLAFSLAQGNGSNASVATSGELLATVDLAAGELAQIEVDYPNAPNLNLTGLRLSWSSLSTPKALIPQHVLYADTSFKFAQPLVSYELLSRIALLVKRFSITIDDLEYLSEHPASFAGVDPNNPAMTAPFNLNSLPSDSLTYAPDFFNQWERLLAFFSLRDGLPGGDVSLLHIFSVASSNPAPSAATLIAAISSATNWEPSELAILLGWQVDSLTGRNYGFGLTAGDFVDERWLVRLQDCFSLISLFGVSSKTLFEWTTLGATLPTEAYIARDVQAAIKARYNNAAWLTVGKSINDKLRKSSRDALVAYILANQTTWSLGTTLRTPDDLYEYFLIDVEMGSCMQTSRIVQAAAAVQLFVQRCLMNLENGVSPGAVDTAIWDWMMNYRVWQANREVLLYPENWIDPTLRDDRTPFFRDLQTQLQQGPVTADSASEALLDYLEKLDQVARLEVCAVYYHNDSNSQSLPDGTPDATQDVLHVFGRTAVTPNLYFYRQLTNASQYGEVDGASVWTPWERVNLDIQGDHLIPVFWNGHLHLFWPIFNEASNSTEPPGISGPTRKQMQIQLAWSHYSQGAWSSKQTSTDYIVPSFLPSSAGQLNTDGSATVTWASGSPFSGAWVGMDINIDAVDFTVKSVESSSSLTLTAATNTTNLTGGLANYTVQATDYSPYYTGVLDPSWFTFSYNLGSNGAIQITAWAPATGVPPYITYSPDQPPAIDRWGDPEANVFPVGTFTMPGCGSDVGAIDLVSDPTYAIYRPDLTIPANTVFSYQSLQEIRAAKGANTNDGTLTIPFANSGGVLQSLVLNSTPTSFSLAADEPGITTHSGSGLGLFISDFDPFFYQDGQRTYFVTPQKITTESFTEVTRSTPAYPAIALRDLTLQTSLPILKNSGRAKAVHKSNQSSPAKSTQTSGAAAKTLARSGPPIQQATRYVPTGSTAGTELEFAPFWHPQICAFIKALNQYGIPTALSLLAQKRSNDGVILWGFVLSPPGVAQNLQVKLTAGALYAQGMFYQTPPGAVPSVPLMNDQQAQSQFLYCDPLGNFYYALSQSPKTAGDALVGRVDADGAGTILRVVQGSALAPSTIFDETYQPTDIVLQPFPLENVDFSFDGAYSIYNWEVFFHIPLLIATQLSQNQQFEDARKWFHYIFNPTTNSTDPVPQRYWNFLPFHLCSATDEIASGIESLLLQLDSPLIASLSPVSGPSGTVFVLTGSNFGSTPGSVTIGSSAAAVLDWSDEKIVAAVPPGATAGAANIAVTVAGQVSNSVSFTVGPLVTNPQSGDCGLDIGTQVSRWMLTPFDPFSIARTRTIAFRKTVVMKYLDNLIAWGDYLFSQNTRESINEATQLYVLAEQILGDKPVSIPQQGTTQDYSYNELVNLGIDDFSNTLVTLESTFPFSTGGANSGSSGAGAGSLSGIAAQSFYFCVPPNDQLLAYWDTVAGRLSNIRNCMNIAGQTQQLPLFSPPINPAVLVRAAASGVDLASVLNDISTPLPAYRFTFVLQKALELCSEVCSLGASLLSALEKNDAEQLTMLRATQESSLLKAVLQIKQSQVEEATDNLAGLQASQNITTFRQQYYQQLISTGLSPYEQTQLTELSAAQAFQMLSQFLDIESGISALVPNVTIGIEGEASSPVSTITFGGVDLQASLAAMSRAMGMLSSFHSYTANLASIMGGWDRRTQEWNFQLGAATKELVQIKSQIDAAGVRVQIAQDDLQNQQLQIRNAQAVIDLLNSKYTNQELYSWMAAQLSATYFQCYQMAYALAKKAEACFRFELGITSSSYIQFGYWDSLRKGLLAGESLYADLKRMESAYFDQNQREYEITKYVSLVLFDPLALIALKETGTCVVSLPEALFDMDYPGQYMRRLKTVSLTIPCVTGPYTGVSAKLTLVSSQTRIDNNARNAQDYAQDSHFTSNLAATQSIATSSAQNDSGMFELNFRDERYLPFEGGGAVSQWLLEMPRDCNAFEFDTISDVIFNLKYTAREGGGSLRAIARQAAVLPGPADQPGNGDTAVSFPKQSNLVRMFSLRHEFPAEWSRFLNPLPSDPAQTMLLGLGKERFPFQYRGKKISVFQLDLILQFKTQNNAAKFKTGTPLGDFASRQGSSGLKIYISQAAVVAGRQLVAPAQPSASASAVSLLSVPTYYGGAPFGSVPGISLSPGSWWLQIFAIDNFSLSPSLLDANHHLTAAIDDIFLVCHFTAS